MTDAQFVAVSQEEGNGKSEVDRPEDEELKEFIKDLGGQPRRRKDPEQSGGTSRKALAVVLFVFGLIFFGLGSTVGKNFKRAANGYAFPGQNFLGNYTDPNHPDGSRQITLRHSREQGLALRIVGRDAPSAPIWEAPVKVVAADVIEADFSAKHGPSALKGRLEENGGF